MKLRLPSAVPILVLLLTSGLMAAAQDRRGPKTLENLLDEHAEAVPQGTIVRPRRGSSDPAITAAWERYDKAVRAASASLLERIEKDAERTGQRSDAAARAGREPAKMTPLARAFLEQGVLPSMLDMGLGDARRKTEEAYRDAAAALRQHYESVGSHLRKTDQADEAEALAQEWALLQISLDVAKEPQLDSTWNHTFFNGTSAEITLYSNGMLNAPEGPDTWSVRGSTLIIRWQDADAPEGAWVDTCEVSEDGETYSGTNQVGSRISGKRVR